VLGVERQLHPPGQSRLGPADRQILERLPQESQDLVAARLGPNRQPTALDRLDQRFLELAHAEEVVRLAYELDLAGGLQSLDLIGIGNEHLVGDAVPALVVLLVDMAVIVQPLQRRLHHFLMRRVGRANERIVGDVE